MIIEGSDGGAPDTATAEGTSDVTLDTTALDQSVETIATGDTKTNEEAPADTNANDDKSKAEGEGEGDADFVFAEIVLPEGMEVDAEAMEEAKSLFKEGKLSPDLQQKAADLYGKAVEKTTTTLAETWVKQQTEWQNTIKSDPEMGGKNMTDTLALTARVVDTFGKKDAAEIRQALTATGAGNHPAVVRMFRAIGKAIRPGQVPPGNGGGNGPGTPAGRLYPTDPFKPKE